MSFAALIRAMTEAGAPPEAIALAVEAIEARDTDLATIREKARDKKRVQREAARLAALAGTVPGPSRDMAGTVPDENPSLNKSPQTPKINPYPGTHGESAPTHTRGAAWACPEGVDPQHWRDFRANRRKKKLTDTDTALAGQLRLLERFASDEWPPGRLVQHSAEMGWGKIVDPSEYETPRNGKRPANQPAQQAANPMLAALERRRTGEAGGRLQSGDRSMLANTG